MRLTRVSRSRPVALLLALAWLVPLLVSPNRAHAAPTAATAHDIDITADHTLRLAASATTAPETYGHFARFGLYESTPLSLSPSFNRVVLRYGSNVPADGRVRVDLRALSRDASWSEWQLDIPAGGEVKLAAMSHAVQYRAVLLSNSAATPVVWGLQVERGSTQPAAQATADSALAPTYRLRVTRQGMVGGRTANGHIIKADDMFVSLPSGRALSSRGGYEYQVRLSANGRSVVVPVWDNGPWNHHDDFWNKDRERYRDLPVGWPEDHAAYYEKYNKGLSENGRVRFPSAVDISNAAYWALGLDGAQATVNVSFLWLGADPGAAAKPLNTKPSERPAARQPVQVLKPAPEPAPEPEKPVTPPPPPRQVVEVNDSGASFTAEGSNWAVSHSECGWGGQARSVGTVTRDDQISDQAIWRPKLEGGAYDVFVYVPACLSAQRVNTRALYIVHHATGDAFVVRNQEAAVGTWVSLGRFTFKPGSETYVQVRNLGASDNMSLWIDAVRWAPVS